MGSSSPIFGVKIPPKIELPPPSYELVPDFHQQYHPLWTGSKRMELWDSPKLPTTGDVGLPPTLGNFPYHESIVYDILWQNSQLPYHREKWGIPVYPIDIHFIYGVYYTLDSWGYHFEGFSQHFSPTRPLGDTIKASCSDFPLFSQLSSFTRNLSTPDNPITEPSRAGS